MRDVALQPMGMGQILDAAFTLYRRHFGSMVGVVVILYGPVLLAFVLVFGALVGYAPDDPDPARVIALSGVLVTLFLLVLIAYAAAEGALTKAISDVFLTGRTSVWDACRAALRRIVPLLAGAFLKMLLIGLGAFLGVVVALPFAIVGVLADAGEVLLGVIAGGLGVLGMAVAASIAFALFFAVTPVIMLERVGPVTALGRSSRLSRGRWIRILAVLGIAMLIGLVLWSGGVTLFTLLVPHVVLSQVAQQVISIIFAPYYAICVVLLYYDARIRAEGFDLEVMARQLGSEAAPA